jgi:hypothetical protein
MTERETVRTDGAPDRDPPHEIRTPGHPRRSEEGGIPRFRGDPGDGPRVGLASYELRDPEATFRVIEPYRPGPGPRGPGVGTWTLRVLLTWAVNLGALGAAGIILTVVGTYDPVAYVGWAVVFGVVNASTPAVARLVRRSRAVLLTAAALLAVDVVLVWLMTVLAQPFHSPSLAAIAEAGAVMWLANLPLGVLYVRRGPTSPRQPA